MMGGFEILKFVENLQLNCKCEERVAVFFMTDVIVNLTEVLINHVFPVSGL